MSSLSDGTGQVGPTRLVLPVAELAGRVPGAHVSLLDPFLPVADIDVGVIEELRELFADVVPFAYVLGEPVAFPDGTLYLPPRPVAPFRRITHALRRAFPECVGSAVAFGTVVPHLSVPTVGAVDTPFSAHAREAALLDGTEVLATFGFGTSAA